MVADHPLPLAAAEPRQGIVDCSQGSYRVGDIVGAVGKTQQGGGKYQWNRKQGINALFVIIFSVFLQFTLPFLPPT